MQVLELAEGVVMASVSRRRAAAQAETLSAGAGPGPSSSPDAVSTASRALIEPSSEANAHGDVLGRERHRGELRDFSGAASIVLSWLTSPWMLVNEPGGGVGAPRSHRG